jgi:adenylosuccinate lyase
MVDFEAYRSPFSWRYGSPVMRRIWSEVNKRLIWRKIWLSLAEVQAEFGIVSPEQVADLRKHVREIDVERALMVEAQIHHDLMAELNVFASQSPIGGGVIHMGATSTDVKDNADALRMRESLDVILEKLRDLLSLVADGIDRWADTPLIAFTHLQPAEPSTLGYRLAQYGQDMLQDYEGLKDIRAGLRGKGFKGAVGTAASYVDLLGEERFLAFEGRLSKRLGLPFFLVTTQTYPRKQEYLAISALAGLAGSLYKFAFDLRLLQSPPIGELGEPFGERQVGSSAMPFKRNPIQAEKVDSLARAMAQLPRVAWDNASHSLLERTLDDSANRRTLLPEAFLIADELLETTIEVVPRLRIDEKAMSRNLSRYGPFAATERILVALGKAGADRQDMHERLRVHAMAAWDQVQRGEGNTLIELIRSDGAFSEYLTDDQISALLDVESYIGLAPRRARQLADKIRESL